MKIISLLSLLLIALCPATASAQTPINDKMAHAYLSSCVQQPSGTMDRTTLAEFCQCTATQIQKNMSFEEIKAQAGNDQAARNALNKTITHVYAPCIQHPVRALVAKRCAANPQTADNKDLCNCAADNLAAYTQAEAPKQLLQLFAQNPNITDPSTAFMSTPQFEAAEKQIAEDCSKQTAN
jgi:hypothetical protein